MSKPLAYILYPTALKFKGDSLKIPHYYFEQAQRLCGNGEFNQGSMKAIYSPDYDEGAIKVRILVGNFLKAWFGWGAGHFTATDFEFEIKFTEVNQEGSFWMQLSSSYCTKYNPVV